MESDKRFTHIANDPKYRRIPKGERKVKIDKRFQSMFNDKKFKVKYTVDKRGRPVSHSTTEDLKRYYDLDSDEESEEDKGQKESNSEEESEEQQQEEGDETSDEELEDIQNNEKQVKSKLKNDKNKVETLKNPVQDQIKKKLKNLTVDYARGEGNLLSGESSSDDDETDDDVELLQEEDDSIDHKWGELDADAGITEEATHRLAACNMDWDRIKANDLMVLFNSFLPPGGSISSVIIYPSEFGKTRLIEEETKGPAELINNNGVRDDNSNENEEGSRYHMEKLRQYQLNRLKYYYAVVTCDSATSANKIYTECDGMEYESSATKIDLRFIPDDMEFEDAPKEVCDKLPEMSKYKPRFFTTTALQQAKVDLTWDETNPDRVEIAEKLASGKVDDIADADLQNYLASSSGEDSETEENKKDENNEVNTSDDDCKPKSKQQMINKYKMLLQEIDNKEKSKEKKEIGMEISWGLDLQKKTDQIIKEKKSNTENKTPFEQFLDKRKEKRKEKRENQKKNKNEEQSEESDVPSDIDMNDPYFAEEFNNDEFKSSDKSKNKNKKNKKPIDSDLSDESESEKQERKAQLELLLNDDDDDGKKHFSLKKIQDNEKESKSKNKKRKNKKTIEKNDDHQDDFNVNVNDERFSALFTSHHYNIDPTDPHFKKTKNMDKLITEKIKRRTDDENGSHHNTKKLKTSTNQKGVNKQSAELNVLVKSVKRKAEAFKNKK